jgi:uncharacterized protein
MTARVPLVDYLVLGDGDGDAHLVGNVCAGCEAVYVDRRNACGRCGGTSFAKRRLAATGTLLTFTVVHRSAPGVEVPFVSGLVELDGGGTVRANLRVDPEPERIPLGGRVRLTTFTAAVAGDGSEAVAFGFVPDPGGGDPDGR